MTRRFLLAALFALCAAVSSGETVKIALCSTTDGAPPGFERMGEHGAELLGRVAEMNGWEPFFHATTQNIDLTDDAVARADVIATTFWTRELLASFEPCLQPIAYLPIALYCKEGRADIVGRQPVAWTQVRVAWVRGALSGMDVFLDFAESTGLRHTMQTYESLQEALDAVRGGSADLVLAASACQPEGFARVTEITVRPVYAAVSRRRPDLHRALAASLEKLCTTEHGWWSELMYGRIGMKRPEKPVRMALYQHPGVYEIEGNGRRFGIVADYCRMLEDELGWTIIPIHTSFAGALKHLEEGEVDLVAKVLISPDRADKILFTHIPSGYYQEVLFAAPDSRFDKVDTRTWNGANIGYFGPSAHASLLNEALREANVSVTMQPYTTTDALRLALNQGICDMILLPNSADMRDKRVIFAMPRYPTYFAVAKDRADIRDELDDFLNRKLVQDPDFSARIQRTYIPEIGREESMFTIDELRIYSHARASGRLTQIDVSPVTTPVKGYDSKNHHATGFVGKLFDAVSEKYGIKFACFPPTTPEEARGRLLRHETDLWVEFGSNIQMPEGTPVVETGLRPSQVEVTYPAARPDDDVSDVIAVAETDRERLQTYAKLLRSKRLLRVKTREDAFEAVRSGRAGCTYATSYIAHHLTRKLGDGFETRVIENPIYNPTLKIYADENLDPSRVSMLSKMFMSFSDDEISRMFYEASLEDLGTPLFSRTQLLVAVLLIAVLFAVSMLTVSHLKNNRIRRQNAELGALNGELGEKQKELSKALDEAKASDKARAAFFATFSHEFRTPLNAVIGYADAMRAGVSPIETRAYAEGIGKSARALLDLLTDILDISKLESGGKRVFNEICDIRALIAQINVIFAMQASEKRIALRAEVADNVPRLLLPTSRVSQALVHIVGNAVKFTDYGSVVVKANFAPDPGGVNTGTLAIAVTDTGIGIKAESLKTIFDVFKSEDPRTEGRKNNAAGLGLAIAVRIIKGCGGEISCESVFGRGSTFTVVIPNLKIVDRL